MDGEIVRIYKYGMEKIDKWFEKEAVKSLVRKPWKPTKWDNDLEHLNNRVRGLSNSLRYIQYLSIIIIFIGLLAIIANLSYGGRLINIGLGVIIILLGIWVIIQTGIDYHRSLIAHRRMLEAYSDMEVVVK
jgi:hypothetical protein